MSMFEVELVGEGTFHWWVTIEAKNSFSDTFMFSFVYVSVVYCVFISSCMSSLEVELVGVILNVFFLFMYSQFRSNQSA